MSKKYEYIQVQLASPAEIRGWSYGEVKSGETINYRTSKPERDGLFCEIIFGPQKDYQCACSKSKRQTDIGKRCEKCGVEITESKVRRERMGHIELAAPVIHEWYFKSGKLATLLEMKKDDLRRIIYLASYIVVQPGDTELTKGQILSEQDHAKYLAVYGGRFKALTGAEAIDKLLSEIDLEEESQILRRNLEISPKQKRVHYIKRLEIVESFLNSENKPEWMVLHVLPVLPPDLRPLVQLDGGRFATTDLNKLYKRIIDRNKRLRKLYAQNAPYLMIKNEKRMIQEAVDALIDNSSKKNRRVMEKNRPLKSLSESLQGKQGRFRQNLLGKRVDYSGRSVIVVGPDLQMHQCGLPKKMALSLFRPFVIREMIARELEPNMSTNKAKILIDKEDPLVWGVLEEVIREHPVLLNRAPTLHRLGIQAFEPKLVEGKAIRLHPLVTPAFNADFDGDQMAVHVPLSAEAQAEARLLMLASNNILNPKDGKPVVTPSQDMVLGNFYLTIERAGEIGEGSVFKDIDEVVLAFENDRISLHSRIAIPAKIFVDAKFTDEQREKYLITTYGKLIFNEIIPNKYFPNQFPFVNEPTYENLTAKIDDKFFVAKGESITEKIKKAPVISAFKKGFLADLISHVLKICHTTETSKMLDKMKDLGFKYSTLAGITVASSDVKVIESKEKVVDNANNLVKKYNKAFERGLLTDEERYKKVIKQWDKAKALLENDIKKEMADKADVNHIFMMAHSGARGNASNFTQLEGMRGLMANPAGKTIELPIISAFIEGLTMSEFFISTHGARKGSTDTALKTADSGYLTRRLVDVSQEVIIVEEDCGTDKGAFVEDVVNDDGTLIEGLRDRIIGRYASKDIFDKKTKQIIVSRNEYITEDLADAVIGSGYKKVPIRTNLNCDSKTGLCIKCYGKNLATGGIVEIGEAVGTIAAQSIGEPGTQLTMRTFHTGGVAGSDITQGLPRIEQLFEARKPKNSALLAENSGVVKSIELGDNKYYIVIEGKYETKEHKTDSASVRLAVAVGDQVHVGSKLTEGTISPKELLRATNAVQVQDYILKEVQKVYRSQGVEIQDKHIEVIIGQMFKNVLIIEEGDTNLLPGSIISKQKYYEANKVAFMNGKKPAIARTEVLSITKSAVNSESFLSAASFQQTTKVLTDAVIQGKKDHLRGLKENVIIGGLIPAGTGIISNVDIDYEKPVEDEVEFESVENFD
ncbi:DNA-directed RNA polymerase subunit beta' [Mycoplasmatota bacterium]|nr:DNA-directed RNA polymerase subunit beta' [Mycoplasmatota bacterium]